MYKLSFLDFFQLLAIKNSIKKFGIIILDKKKKKKTLTACKILLKDGDSEKYSINLSAIKLADEVSKSANGSLGFYFKNNNHHEDFSLRCEKKILL